MMRDLVVSLLNRIDAWGTAFVIALLAFLIHDLASVSTISIAATIAAGYWLAFVVNDYFDAPFDAQEATKARRNFFVRHRISNAAARVAFLAASGLLLLSSGLYGFSGLVLCAVFLFVAWAYSAQPLRLKSRPGLDLLTHALFVQTYPYFACLILMGVTWAPVDRAILVVNFLASLSGQLDQQVRDFAVDSKTDVNFATTFGFETAVLGLRAVTAALVVVAATCFALGILPLRFVPLALAFVPAAIQRLRGNGGALPLALITAVTGFSILYTAALFAHHLLA